MEINKTNDGIHGKVPEEKMSAGAAKLRDFYEMKKDAPIYQCEDWYYSLERWKSEGFITDSTDLHKLFRFDEPGSTSLGELGWCEAAFDPFFEEKIIEDRGEHEVVSDTAGRHVLFFKGRRSGFMPEYIDHPVKDLKTWEENCKWRLDPETPGRYATIGARMDYAKSCAAKGMMITQNIVGGYMYLRSLIGPEALLYKFYDDPDLIHECMKTWFELNDAVITRHQEYVTVDEIYIGEDICYNHGSLISPDMIKEFLFPYYSQLLANTKARQLDKNRHLYFQVDTDGYANPVIPLYREIGLDFMNPFEVASGSDVVEIGKQFPYLLMRGGFDKRIMALGKDEIDREIERILPVMKKRGGYMCACDHGVPEEVSFENYMHYRNRVLEYGI
ncbi:MAG: uroporphyrinogen decarboxylase family protein [Saccharofermentanales bacterium]